MDKGLKKLHDFLSEKIEQINELRSNKMDGLDGIPLINHFQNDVDRVIDKYRDQGLTLGEAVGALEICKNTLLNEDDDDDDDDDGTFDGDDPKCDGEYVARCRENWKR